MVRLHKLAAVFLVGLLAVPTVGCEMSFSVTEPLPVRRIEGNPLGGLIPEMSWNADVSAQPEFQSQDFERIRAIWVRDLVLEIQSSTPEVTFDFASSVEIRISAVIDGTPQEELVAWIPEGDPQFETRELRLTTTGVDILPFIQADSGYSIRVNYEGQAPEEDVDVGGHVQYRLKVKL